MINIFYRPEMAAPSNVSASPSAGKPTDVVNDWVSGDRTKDHVAINGTFDPLTPDQIAIAHDPDFVTDVLNCTRANGFGNYNPEVAVSLPYTSGSLYAAVKYAIENKTVAVSPTSGFHHAGYKSAEGFCTFNGLMITSMLLLEAKAVKRVLILDFDMHWGNGTDDIITQRGVNNVVNITYGRWTTPEQVASICNKEYLSASIVEMGFDLVIYQAGADIHEKDPYGGILSTEQMIERDRAIFTACKQVGVPLVWNLAGGYQRDSNGGIMPVIDLHRNTMIECINAYK